MCVFGKKRLTSKLAGESVSGKSVFVLCNTLLGHFVAKRPYRTWLAESGKEKQAALPHKPRTGFPGQSPGEGWQVTEQLGAEG